MEKETTKKTLRPVLQLLVNEDLFNHWINGMSSDKKKIFRFLVSELLAMDIKKPNEAKMAGYIEYVRSFVNPY